MKEINKEQKIIMEILEKFKNENIEANKIVDLLIENAFALCDVYCPENQKIEFLTEAFNYYMNFLTTKSKDK